MVKMLTQIKLRNMVILIAKKHKFKLAVCREDIFPSTFLLEKENTMILIAQRTISERIDLFIRRQSVEIFDDCDLDDLQDTIMQLEAV